MFTFKSRMFIKKAAAWALLVIANLYFINKDRIWLIACGRGRWGDNAEALFKYLKKYHPDVNASAVVLNISDISDDEVICLTRNSLKHILCLFKAEVLATTHSISLLGPKKLIRMVNAKKIWLQHGVTSIKGIENFEAKNGFFDMVCVNSEKEKNICVNELGLKKNILKITGLARHDLLQELVKQELPKKGILFIPTKREWINANKKAFYERTIFSWINTFTETHDNIDIKIWLHPGWHLKNLEKVEILNEKVTQYGLKQDPQQLIIESKILITDYSSVFFDAALSKIPTIFYQPDRQYYTAHKKLRRDFLEQKFLLVVDDKNELIQQIDMLLNREDYYQERIRYDQKWAYQYVETFDGKACQRIYENIMALS